MTLTLVEAFMKNWFMYSLATLLAAGCSLTGQVRWTPVDPAGLLKNPPAGISVRRFVIKVNDKQKITGYMFEPVKGKACPAILYLHWLGGNENVDRSALEFYAEAAEMARQGFVCAVPDGYFPWSSAPRGDERDLVMIRRQLDENRRLLGLLTSNRKVDKSRIALVGHDYGGMHALLTAASEPGITALVVMTPVAEYYEWNRIVSQMPDGEKMEDYREMLKPLDPVTVAVQRGGIPLLYQYSEFDEYVSPENAERLIAASGENTEVLWYPATHELNRHKPATDDRIAWLIRFLR
jgi:dienelactone hydrolase